MTFHQELLQSCPPSTGNMFGNKQDGLEKRVSKAQYLTLLMQTHRPFCFLRMGDMELVYLLSHQYGRTEALEYGDGPTAGTQGFGCPGVGSRYYHRLRKAYEEAEYVDFHEKNWLNVS